MADYLTQVVVRPSIPNACMTPLERWLLEQMLESEPDDDDTTCFFASEGIVDLADATDELEAKMRDDTSSLAAAVRGQLPNANDPGSLDLDAIGHAAVFQAIIARHTELIPYVTLEMAFTCSRMRPDGFGGGAKLITADAVSSVYTGQWVDEQLEALERETIAGGVDDRR